MSFMLTAGLLGLIATILGLVSVLLSPRSLLYRSADPGQCELLGWPLLLEQASSYYSRPGFFTLPGECYFSAGYRDAFQRFDAMAKELGLDVQHLNVTEDLATQVAIYSGRDDKYLVHISGIHGVESFAGDAVQLSSLQYLQHVLKTSENKENLPTIVFVHIANPYGFHNLRRVNEDNVDLNRNFLTEDEWTMVKARDPNYAHYVDFDFFLNPTDKPTHIPLLDEMLYVYTLVSNLLKYPMHTVKKAVVAGNYHKQDGYGFGGFQHTASTRNIINLLTQQLDLPAKARDLVLIDVHTGLGPYGVDTIMYDSTSDIVRSIFPTEYEGGGYGYDKKKGRTIGGLLTNAFGGNAQGKKGDDHDAVAESVSAGYELTVGKCILTNIHMHSNILIHILIHILYVTHTHIIGTVSEGLCKNFVAPQLPDEHRVCVTQEFGTVPVILVGKVWYMVYGMWYMANGEWRMVYGVWCMVYGKWCIV
ncbi:DUF2817 domain-containing protein [archaeon]|nr:MAG: DUF2817 domain-containing protein [archaeon]